MRTLMCAAPIRTRRAWMVYLFLNTDETLMSGDFAEGARHRSCRL